MRIRAITFLLLFSLCLTFVVLVLFSTEAQTEYSIAIEGRVWNHSTLTVNLIPQENQSWWKASYLDAALHDIEQWNDAIQDFTFDYPEFSYVSPIHLVPTVNSENVSGFDIYITWMAMCKKEETIGLSQLTVMSHCLIVNGTVCIAAKAPSGHIMTEVDVQNIIAHEIGHTLGLSHCNVSSDIMYPTVYYLDTVKPISSLDMYAVSQIFDWIKTSVEHNFSIPCLRESVITMPQSIIFRHLPIASENLPMFQNFMNYAIEFVLSPEILMATIVAGVSVATVAILKRRKQNTKKSFNR